ncbi:MAG: hypothetical protein DME26_11530 [Verrucomicrobia bacterium]|nr:MAG: hypothetical protein DME26_11530 [Verrucomicrobiota bacterium]
MNTQHEKLNLEKGSANFWLRLALGADVAQRGRAATEGARTASSTSSTPLRETSGQECPRSENSHHLPSGAQVFWNAWSAKTRDASTLQRFNDSTVQRFNDLTL